jgi:3-(3-hydroxy-phenyl)propionate hydroxylase
MENVSVLIVGAGPTGLSLGIELAAQGINFKIIDKALEPSTLSKALLLQAKTLELFDEWGITNSVMEQAIHLKGVIAHFGSKEHKIDFLPLKSKYPYGILLPQCDTESILRKKLESYDKKVFFDCELTGVNEKENTIEVELKSGQKISAQYLIAADGAHSSVRHYLEIAFEGTSLETPFALADVLFEKDSSCDYIELFTKKGLMILFPLPEGYQRVVVEDLDAHKDSILTKEILQKILYENGCNYSIKDTKWLSYFHINSRHVPHYRYNGVFFIGDSAHIHSPAGGLGMNTGIQDAFNLGWKLSGVLKGRLNKKILNTYEEERMPIAKEVLEKTQKLTFLMTLNNKILLKLRNFFMPKLMHLISVRKKMLNSMAQLNINYSKSSISYGRLGGYRMKDQEVELVDKTKIKLFDILKTRKFVLLIQAPKKTSKFTTLIGFKDDIVKKYGHIIEAYLVESSLKDDIILIRPDQYVAASMSNDSLNLFFQYCNENFI